MNKWQRKYNFILYSQLYILMIFSLHNLRDFITIFLENSVGWEINIWWLLPSKIFILWQILLAWKNNIYIFIIYAMWVWQAGKRNYAWNLPSNLQPLPISNLQQAQIFSLVNVLKFTEKFAENYLLAQEISLRTFTHFPVIRIDKFPRTFHWKSRI